MCSILINTVSYIFIWCTVYRQYIRSIRLKHTSHYLSPVSA